MNYKERRSVSNIRIHRPNLTEGAIYSAAKRMADNSSYCPEHFLRISALRAAQGMPLLWEL